MQISRFGAAPAGKQVSQNATQNGGGARGRVELGRSHTVRPVRRTCRSLPSMAAWLPEPCGA